MSSPQIQPNEGQKSLLQIDTEEKTRRARRHGQIYNSNYSIENFMNIVSDPGNHGEMFKVLTDPTYSGFKLFFHFDAKTGLLADDEYVNSALAYLKRIGDDTRYAMLQRFIKILSQVNSITPWMFQELEGIQELYTEPYDEIYKERKLNILCLETVDNKILSLIQMYRAIAYDHTTRRWILPVNLRRFSMSVFVYDYRVFADNSSTAIDFLQTIQNTDVSQLNHTLFDLGYCSFDIASGGSYFETVSNTRSDANVNNISINFEQFDISGLFKSLTGHGKIGSSAIHQAASIAVNNTADVENDRLKQFFSKDNFAKRLGVDKLKEKYEALIDTDAWKTKLEDTAINVAADTIENIRGVLGNLYLGNVYGFDIADIANAGQNTLRQTFRQTQEIPSLRNYDNTRGKDLGNAFEQ